MFIPNTVYHIYNRANGRENLFAESENYRFFLELYGKYIGPVAETYAFCLMPNHFHFLLRTKAFEDLPGLIDLEGLGEEGPRKRKDSSVSNSQTSSTPTARLSTKSTSVTDLFFRKMFEEKPSTQNLIFSAYWFIFTKTLSGMGLRH